MKKRNQFACLALTLVFLLTACSGGSASPTAAPSAPTQAPVSQASAAPAQAQTAAPAEAQPAEAVVSYPLEGNPTITIARTLDIDLPTAGFTSYNDTPNVKAWSEAIGANIEFVELADATAFLLYLASGSTADVIQTDTRTYPGGIVAMHNDGLAVDITEEMEKYAPDYWGLIHSDPAYVNIVRQPNGSFYHLGGYLFEIGSPFRAWVGLAVRQEFLDKLQINAPETADEVYEYLSRLKNELNVATPLMSDKARWDHMHKNSGGGFYSAFGLVTTGRFHVDGKVHFGFFDPEYKDYLAFMNKLYKEGLLDPNFAVTDEPTAQSAMMSGQSGMMYTAASRINSMTQSYSGTEPFTLLGIKNLRTPDGGEPMFTYVDPYVTGGFNVFIPEGTKADKIPNIMMAYNYLFTKEGRLLSNYGQEGVTYDMVNGEPKLNEFVTKNPNGNSLDGMLRAYGMMNFPIIMEINMSKQRFPLPQQVTAIANWADSQADKYKVINESISPEFIDEYAGLYTDIMTYVDEARAQFISGALSIDEFESTYIARLKSMGSDRLLEIYQKSYEMFNK